MMLLGEAENRLGMMLLPVAGARLLMAGLADNRESCGVWLPNWLAIAGGWFWEVVAVPAPGPGRAPSCPARPMAHWGPQLLEKWGCEGVPRGKLRHST